MHKRVKLINKNKAFPLFLAYNIPKRDCGQYSAGGAAQGDAYKTWISAFARAIGPQRAAVVLEPDALGLLKKCLSDADQKERLELLRFAVHAFETQMNTAVYIDAGNAGWIEAPEMAKRLKAAGVDDADGFALNVSNYKTTEATIKYGKEISKRLGGKHFVIDTSRNGKGPPEVKGDVEAAWCNPSGRGLGTPPTTNTARSGRRRLSVAEEARRIRRPVQRRPQGRHVVAGEGAGAREERELLGYRGPGPRAPDRHARAGRVSGRSLLLQARPPLDHGHPPPNDPPIVTLVQKLPALNVALAISCC